MVVLYTIGHSTRTVDELVEVLRAHGVARVADVRSIRRSRAHPWVAEAALRRSLPARGVAYAVVEALGGRRGRAKTPPARANDAWRVDAFRNYADYATTRAFAAGLRELLALAEEQPTAMMCSEAVWWRCHRRIVADWALARGAKVVHLMSRTKAEDGTLTPFAVVTRGRVSYPATPSPRARGSRAARPPRRPPRRGSRPPSRRATSGRTRRR